MNRRLKNSPLRIQGFSLIEIIVALAIVLVLSALILFSYARFLDRSHSLQCQSHVRYLGSLIQLYASDHDNNLLPAEAPSPYYYWYNMLDRYGYLNLDELRSYDDNFMRCPARDVKLPRYQLNTMHYGMNIFPGFLIRGKPGTFKMTRIQNPNNTFLLGEISTGAAIYGKLTTAAYPHDGKITLYFANGSVSQHQGPLNPLPNNYDTSPPPSSSATWPFY